MNTNNTIATKAVHSQNKRWPVHPQAAFNSTVVHVEFAIKERHWDKVYPTASSDFCASLHATNVPYSVFNPWRGATGLTNQHVIKPRSIYRILDRKLKGGNRVRDVNKERDLTEVKRFLFTYSCLP
jgi:hypothetical protein